MKLSAAVSKIILLSFLKWAMLNPTELVAALVGSQATIAEGIRYAQELIDGSMTMLVLTKDGIYAARDNVGRTSLVLGEKEDGYCVASESFF